MGVFKSYKIISGSPSLIPEVGRDVMNRFMSEGYDVHGDLLTSGGYDISISKGNIFKAVLGMKTALKIVMRPQAGQIAIEAGVGVFGQQAIPSIISMLFFWPILVTQIWGIVQQSNLDEKAIEIAETSVFKHSNGGINGKPANDQNKIFCTQCGKGNELGVKFCGECGAKL